MMLKCNQSHTRPLDRILGGGLIACFAIALEKVQENMNMWLEGVQE